MGAILWSEANTLANNTEAGKTVMKMQYGIAILGLIMVTAAPAAADEGRYTMTERDGEMVVFDSVTGRISKCDNVNTPAFACTLVPDDRAALEDTLADLQDEVDRLEDENKDLKERLVALGEDIPEKAAPKKAAPDNDDGKSETSQLKLPSREDVDEMMDFLEHLSDRMAQMGDRMREWVGDEPPATLQPKDQSQ